MSNIFTKIRKLSSPRPSDSSGSSVSDELLEPPKETKNSKTLTPEELQSIEQAIKKSIKSGLRMAYVKNVGNPEELRKLVKCVQIVGITEVCGGEKLFITWN